MQSGVLGQDRLQLCFFILQNHKHDTKSVREVVEILQVNLRKIKTLEMGLLQLGWELTELSVLANKALSLSCLKLKAIQGCWTCER